MIYFLDENPKLAGDSLADKHLSCMLCNTCTIISTILNNNDIEVIQKTYPKNNIIVSWASMTPSNYKWLCEYSKSIYENFEKRYGRKHQTSVDLYKLPDSLPKIIESPLKGLTEFPQLMPDKYKIETNPVEAYRNYYVCEKAKLSDYKNEPPEWFIEKLSEADRTIFLDYFEELGYSLRLYRDKKKGIVLQNNSEGNWVTLDNLILEHKILFERIFNRDVGR